MKNGKRRMNRLLMKEKNRIAEQAILHVLACPLPTNDMNRA